MHELLNEALVCQPSQCIHCTPAPVKDPWNEVREPASGPPALMPMRPFCGPCNAWGARARACCSVACSSASLRSANQAAKLRVAGPTVRETSTEWSVQHSCRHVHNQAQRSRSRAPRPKTTVHITEDRGLRPAVTAPRKIHADRTDTFDSRISMFACSLFLERLCAISCDLRVSSCRPLQGQAPQ